MTNENHNTIGKRIAQLRRAANLSQEYVAQRVGVTRQAVSKWEQDLSAPDTYNLIALAELFGVSVEYLATGTAPCGPLQPAAPAAPAAAGPSSVRRAVGLLLLGFGLLAGVLGVLFSWLLLIAAVYLLVGGLLCLFARKNGWLIALWIYLLFTFLWVSVLTTGNLFAVFYYPAGPSAPVSTGFTVWGIVSLAFWVALAAAVIITAAKIVRALRRRQKPAERQTDTSAD